MFMTIEEGINLLIDTSICPKSTCKFYKIMFPSAIKEK